MTREYVSGTFSDGGQLSGYFDVDPTTGAFVDGDITAEGQRFYNPVPSNMPEPDSHLTSTQNPDGSYNILGSASQLFGRFTESLQLTYSGTSPSSFSSGSSQSVADSTYYNNETLMSSEISDQPIVCFVTGTNIRTSRGDVPVEQLAEGDLVVTISGDHSPVRWLGSRAIDCSSFCRPSEAWPVCVSAGAFGGDVPERDLYLSPGHLVLVGAGESEALVPIMCLINGTSIKRVAVDRITYWHIELEQHSILLAEGLPAESYLDWGDRPFFTEGPQHALAHPDFIAPGLPGRCRAVATSGPIVEGERRRLDSVFAVRLAAACSWPSAEHRPFVAG